MGLFGIVRKIFGRDTSGTDSSAPTDPGSAGSGDGTGGVNVPADVGDGDRVPPGALVADSREDLRDQAEEFAEFWAEYEPDFTPSSIPRLDEMFATQQDNASYLEIELDDGRTGAMAPLASGPACYFGETMVRNYDVAWAFDEDFGWALQFADGTLINLFKTAHRALDGDPPFVVSHDTFVERFDLEGEPIEPEGDGIEIVSVDDGIDPGDFDDDDIEEAAADLDPDSMVDDLQDDAEDFVSSWPAYDLDFSVESLERVDELVDAEFGRPEFADAEIGSTDDEASILLTAHTVDAGAYFAEVFRRTTEATWRHSEEDGLRIELPGATAATRIDPIGVAEKCIGGDGSFAGMYDTIHEILEEVEAESGD